MQRVVGRSFLGLVCIALVAALFATPGSAWALGGVKLCIPEKANAAVKTPNTSGACTNTKAVTYRLTELGAEGKEGKPGPEGKEGRQGPEASGPFSAEETTLLKSVLPYVKYVASGVGGKPTIQFSGVNVQVVSGLGHEEELNGEGNLVIGYDANLGVLRALYSEPAAVDSGSNNLIVGEEQEFTSFGGIDAGVGNSIVGPYASVTGGILNTSGERATVTGGGFNNATGEAAVVGGGYENTAKGRDSSIFGGKKLTASGEYEALP